MNYKTGSLKLLFLISFLLGAAGFYLTASSYYKKLALTSGYKQLTFMKNMPSLAADGSRYRIPAFTEDPALKSEKLVDSFITSSYHEDKISLRKVSARSSGPLWISTRLDTILDARERYEKK